MASKILTFGTVNKRQNDPFNWSGAVGSNKQDTPAATTQATAMNSPTDNTTGTVTENNASTLQGDTAIAEGLKKKKSASLSSQLGINA